MPIKMAKTSERLKAMGVDDVAALTLPAKSVVEEAESRHARLNLVRASGCAVCTHRETGSQTQAGAEPYDGSRIQCPYFVMDGVTLTPEQRKVAEACQVPQLYADVHDGIIRQVTEKDVERLIPFFGDPSSKDAEESKPKNGERLKAVFPEVTENRAEAKAEAKEAEKAAESESKE